MEKGGEGPGEEAAFPRAGPPAFRRCPSTSARVSAVASTAFPQAPRNRAAGGRATEPRPTSRSVSLALPEGFPRFFHFRAPRCPLPQDSALLPESASCVACVPPCWPLRPVPSDVERGGGGRRKPRESLRGARYVTRRREPREGVGGRGAVPGCPRAWRRLCPPWWRELEIAGPERTLRSGPESRRVGKSPGCQTRLSI